MSGEIGQEAQTITLRVDGEEVRVPAGSTVLDATRKLGRDVPTLCHDDRVDPMGSCRMCLVEIDGQRRLQPGCKCLATDGMVVATGSDRVKRHRELLLSLYLADHAVDADGLPSERGVGNRLREHVDSVERDAIIKALADSNHNQTHAARRLGLSRRALIYKMEKYGLKPPPGAARKG